MVHDAGESGCPDVALVDAGVTVHPGSQRLERIVEVDPLFFIF